jgi:hypothetical protein
MEVYCRCGHSEVMHHMCWWHRPSPPVIAEDDCFCDGDCWAKGCSCQGFGVLESDDPGPESLPDACDLCGGPGGQLVEAEVWAGVLSAFVCETCLAWDKEAFTPGAFTPEVKHREMAEEPVRCYPGAEWLLGYKEKG